MKNLRTIIFGTIFLFLATSCSKDNLAAKKLNGSWEITSLKINSTELITPISSADITFSSVIGNAGKFNTKIYILGNLDSETNGNFNVSDKGNKITLDDDNGDPGTGSIIELTASFLNTSYTDGDGNTVIIKADKK